MVSSKLLWKLSLSISVCAGGRVPAGRPAVGSGRARGPAAVRRVHQRVPAALHARARHAPAALPQGRRLHRHHEQRNISIDTCLFISQ